MRFAPDESANRLFVEKTLFQGPVLNAVAYGSQFMLYTICLHVLWSCRRQYSRKRTYFFLSYTTALVILGTLNAAASFGFTQDVFINDRAYPGGPATYHNQEFSSPINAFGNVSYMVSNWACEALMVRECSFFACVALMRQKAVAVMYRLQDLPFFRVVRHGASFCDLRRRLECVIYPARPCSVAYSS
jgi:hypothetical protein